MDPADYENKRFNSPAGQLIDEVEKKSVLDLILKNKNPGDNLKISDVAAGTGRLSFYLEKYLANAEIFALDINETMLAAAQKKARKNKSKVKFTRGDLYKLPYEGEKFDIVVGLRFSMHLPQMGKVLSELQRVLRKDGILIFDIFNKRSLLGIKLLKQQNPSDLGFYTKEKMINMAEKVGLEYVEDKGIMLFGETILRKLPNRLLNLFALFNKPPFFFADYSTKIIICFRKSE